MKRTILEVSVFTISVVIILIVSIGLIMDINRGRDRSVNFKIAITSVRKINDSYDVAIKLTNLGRQTAEQVTVEGTVNDETASITFDYLPNDSSNRGVLRFTADPERFPLRTRVISYRLP
jgi:uncharacterized protein (TIGR02588 family)